MLKQISFGAVRAAIVLSSFSLLVAAAARADVVELTNGDKINGKVGEIAGGKMKFTSPVLGDITIDMANVKTFSTDEPATIQPKHEQRISDRITAGDAAKIQTAGGTTMPSSDIKSINPPPQQWNGKVLVTGQLARGNSNTEDLGVELSLSLRRDDDRHNDRTTLTGSYHFGRTGTGDAAVTDPDDWHASAKYDRFWTEKFYGYGLFAVDHDRIAALNYRLAPARVSDISGSSNRISSSTLKRA